MVAKRIAPTETEAQVSNAQFARFVKATNFTTESETFGWSFVFEHAVSKAVGYRLRCLECTQHVSCAGL